MVETLLYTVAGVALVLVACRDIFDSLFHPEGNASVGRAVARSVCLARTRASHQSGSHRTRDAPMPNRSYISS